MKKLILTLLLPLTLLLSLPSTANASYLGQFPMPMISFSDMSISTNSVRAGAWTMRIGDYIHYYYEYDSNSFEVPSHTDLAFEFTVTTYAMEHFDFEEATILIVSNDLHLYPDYYISVNNIVFAISMPFETINEHFNIILEFSIFSPAPPTDVEEAYWNGYYDGTVDGYQDGQDEGYQLGYDYGHSIGDSEGYNRGLNEGTSAWGILFSAMLSTFGTVLGIEIFPGLTIGMLVAVPLILGLLSFIIGVAKGGNKND